MKKSLIAWLVSSALLTACGGGDDGGYTAPPGNGPDQELPDQERPDPELPEGNSTARLLAMENLPLSGSDIACNGRALNAEGEFTFDKGTALTCEVGGLTLFHIDKADSRQNFEITNNRLVKDKPELQQALVELLESVDAAPADRSQILLTSEGVAPIRDLYLINGEKHPDLDDYLSEWGQRKVDIVDIAPSSHSNGSVVPATDSDANSVSLSDPSAFISANAEATYAYQPSADEQVPTQSVLTDALGRPLAGVAYFTASSRGITGADGVMEYRWGETITLGIDTFTFGEVKGNQLRYKLTDVSDNVLVKQNLQALVERYGHSDGEGIAFAAKVAEVFAQYPNAINEIINVSLPNGTPIDGSDFATPNEFVAQFERGLAAQIDSQLAQTRSFRFY
ncbi:MAG: hypothetical protein ACRCYV_07690, partial [Aeromonas sp.]